MPGSPADDLFFVPGSIITRVNGMAIAGADDFVKAIKTLTKDSKAVLETQLGGFGVFHMDKKARDALTVQSPPMTAASWASADVRLALTLGGEQLHCLAPYTYSRGRRRAKVCKYPLCA